MNKRQAQFVTQMIRTSDVVKEAGYFAHYSKNINAIYRDSYYVHVDHNDRSELTTLRTAEDVFNYISDIENKIRMKEALE